MKNVQTIQLQHSEMMERTKVKGTSAKTPQPFSRSQNRLSLEFMMTTENKDVLFPQKIEFQG